LRPENAEACKGNDRSATTELSISHLLIGSTTNTRNGRTTCRFRRTKHGVAKEKKKIIPNIGRLRPAATMAQKDRWERSAGPPRPMRGDAGRLGTPPGSVRQARRMRSRIL
jgi:hypothetical protein